MTPPRMPDLSAGACVGRLEEFDDITTATAPRAIQVCNSGCPVMQDCATWGIRHERFGVWGAMAERTLTAQRKRLGIRLEEPRHGEIAPRSSSRRPAA